MEGFVYLSRYAGMREDLVQAGGGNSSVKLSSSEMVIKASGFQLADLSGSKGWCTVNPAGIAEFFSQDNPEITKDAEKKLLGGCLVTERNNPGEPHPLSVRPSIEVFLHSVTQKYTLHTHPAVVNILASTDAGWNELKDKIVFLSRHADVLRGLEAFGPALWDWQFCPDCIVYCGKKPLVLGDSFGEADFGSYAGSYGPPSIISHKGNAYILSDSVRKAKDTESVLAFSARVALANKARGLRMSLLPDAGQDFLLDWDAEKYRRNRK